MQLAPLNASLTSLAVCCSSMLKGGIGSSIGLLTNLEEIDISTNEIDFLSPEIAKATGLRSLVIDTNSIKFLPSTLGTLTKLQNLDFVANKVENLPSELGRCTELTSLRGDFNQISGTIPKSFSALSKLRIFTMVWHLISSFLFYFLFVSFFVVV